MIDRKTSGIYMAWEDPVLTGSRLKKLRLFLMIDLLVAGIAAFLIFKDEESTVVVPLLLIATWLVVKLILKGTRYQLRKQELSESRKDSASILKAAIK